MKPSVVVTVLMTLNGVAPAASAQTTNSRETTVREGVYSLDQAKGGLIVYDKKCATCHDGGGTFGPELWGEAFRMLWADKTVDGLYGRIKDTMPEDSPGTLTEGEVLSLIAYILQQNDFPAGEKAIESEQALRVVRFVTGK